MNAPFVKRTAWLALLLPQFAALFALAFHEMRELRADLQGRGEVICGNSIMPFSPVGFVLDLLGIAAVIGLCGNQCWGRALYLVLGSVFLVLGAQTVLDPPPGSPSFLPVEVAVLITWVMCLPRRTSARPMPRRQTA